MSRIIRAFDPEIGPLVRVTVTDPDSYLSEHEQPRTNTVALLLDTGARDTALKWHIIDQLGLSVLGIHGVHSFSTEPAHGFQYSADLVLHLDNGATKEFSDWKLFRFETKYDKIDGVIGRDILNQAKLFVDGPGRKFTLEF